MIILCLQMGPMEERTDLDSDEEIPFSSSPNARKVHPFNFETEHLAPRTSIVNSWIHKGSRISPIRSIYIVLIKAKINILLPFGPLAVLLHYLTGNQVSRALTIFTLS